LSIPTIRALSPKSLQLSEAHDTALSDFLDPMITSCVEPQRTANPAPMSPVPPTRAIFMACRSAIKRYLAFFLDFEKYKYIFIKKSLAGTVA
jgi:hypothetical protein